MNPEDVRKEYTRRAEKELDALNEPLQSRIKAGVEKLPDGDVIKVKGHKTLYRLRIGKTRIIFDWIAPEDILIVTIGSRGQVYREV